MGKLPNRLSSKNTPLWSTPLTAKSPRRSPSSRVHSAGRHSPKIRGVWDNTHNSHPRPPLQRHNLPNYRPGPMGGDYNRVHLPTTDGPQISYRLLLCQPHRPCCRRNSNPNPMRFYRGACTNNRPRPSFLCPILPR